MKFLFVLIALIPDAKKQKIDVNAGLFATKQACINALIQIKLANPNAEGGCEQAKVPTK